MTKPLKVTMPTTVFSLCPLLLGIACNGPEKPLPPGMSVRQLDLTPGVLSTCPDKEYDPALVAALPYCDAPDCNYDDPDSATDEQLMACAEQMNYCSYLVVNDGDLGYTSLPAGTDPMTGEALFQIFPWQYDSDADTLDIDGSPFADQMGAPIGVTPREIAEWVACFPPCGDKASSACRQYLNGGLVADTLVPDYHAGSQHSRAVPLAAISALRFPTLQENNRSPFIPRVGIKPFEIATTLTRNGCGATPGQHYRTGSHLPRQYRVRPNDTVRVVGQDNLQPRLDEAQVGNVPTVNWIALKPASGAVRYAIGQEHTLDKPYCWTHSVSVLTGDGQRRTVVRRPQSFPQADTKQGHPTIAVAISDATSALGLQASNGGEVHKRQGGGNQDMCLNGSSGRWPSNLAVVQCAVQGIAASFPAGYTLMPCQ